MEKLAWLHVGLGSSSYLLITLLVKFKVFIGRRSIFFHYVMANNIALVVCTIVMLPEAIKFPDLVSQIAFGGSVLFLKCIVLFHAQSTGKFLIFNTVSFDNANLVDGFRCVIGYLIKSSMFYFFLFPAYFGPPAVLMGAVLVWCLLFRRSVHLNKNTHSTSQVNAPLHENMKNKLVPHDDFFFSN